MMKNVELLLLAGTIATFAVYFVIVPVFVFLLCVRKKSGKWYIKKGAMLRFLLFFSKGDTPKNTCYLYVDAVLAACFATVILFVFFLFSFFFCGMVSVIVSAVIEYPKTFLALLLSIKFIAVIVWKTRVYTKTEAWRNQKDKTKDQINKLFQVFQKASNKVCIKFENV